jgi:hypothetical protein
MFLILLTKKPALEKKIEEIRSLQRVTDHEYLLNFIKETVMTKKHPKIEAVTLLINNGGRGGGFGEGFNAAVTSCDDRGRRRSRSNGCGAHRTASSSTAQH